MLDFIIIAALCVSGLLFCLTKWGILSMYSVYRKGWMPTADCYFCMSFWAVLLPASFYIEMVKGERVSFSQPFTIFDLYVTVLSFAVALASATLSAFICTVIIEPKGV